MGGATVSSDSTVIARHERDRAQRVLEDRIPDLVETFEAARVPSRRDVEHFLSALRVLLRQPSARPIVLAALGLPPE